MQKEMSLARKELAERFSKKLSKRRGHSRIIKRLI